MKIVNRGYLSVKALQPFIEWVNGQEDEFIIDEQTEPNIYLIDEDFFDLEPVIKSNFKKIFLNELQAISEDEESYPTINMENFEAWFSVEAGTSVFDCEKGGLNAD
jgi:hypothetical protein